MQKIIEKYIHFIKQSQPQKHSSEDAVWAAIQQNIQQEENLRIRAKKKYLWAVSIAACLVAAFFLFLLQWSPSRLDENLQAHAANTESNHIKLISSTGEKKEIESESINFTYHAQENHSPKAEKITTETLITPKGKICKLVLSDGSIIHVNANSSVTYPKVFAANERRIQVEGEVFCEVEKADKIPFYVETENFTVKVVGTKFNVSAYKKAEINNVILVSGEVHLSNDQEERKLKPRQMAIIQEGKLQSLRNVETARFTSWVDGYLVLKSEKLSDIFLKLEQFYGVSIACEKELATEQFSGKLDLSQNIEDVLDIIQFTMSVSVEKDAAGFRVDKTVTQKESSL